MKTLIIKSAIALILISFISVSVTANQTGKKHQKRTADSEFYFITERATEKHLTIEEWMTDIDYFSFSIFNDLTEAEIQLSGWMYDPHYFYPVALYREIECAIDLEAWMADPGYFHNPAKMTSGK